MMAFGTTKPAIDAITLSKFPLSMLDQPRKPSRGHTSPEFSAAGDEMSGDVTRCVAATRREMLTPSSRRRSTSRCKRSIPARVRICAPGWFAARASAWVNAIVAIEIAWRIAERTWRGQLLGTVIASVAL
jgi:hypothetical protein